MSDLIRRARLADQAYDWIKERILTRALLPGDRLSVPALAEVLGLSRSPVREAVQRLVQEGLSTERPHSGAVVAAPDLHSLVDLYEVRAVLEGLSAERATLAGDPALVEDLAVLLARHREAYETGRRPDVIRADTAFHERLLEAAGNPELQRLLGPVLQRMSLGMLAAAPHWPARALAEHEAVLDAVRADDSDAAREAMTTHVRRVRSDLVQMTEEEQP